MHLGLLYELVLRVWECGRRRPLACQYVLMLHIWFPNFPFSLSALPSAPSNEKSGHCFVFAGWWRGCQMSDGPVMQHITFPSLLLLSLVHSFLLLFRLYSGALTPTLTVYWTLATKHIYICQTKMTTPSSSLFFSVGPFPWCRIKAYICQVWCRNSKGQSKVQKEGWKKFSSCAAN